MRWHAIKADEGTVINGSMEPAQTGVCVLCGELLNPQVDYNQDCPNPKRLTRVQAMMKVFAP